MNAMIINQIRQFDNNKKIYNSGLQQNKIINPALFGVKIKSNLVSDVFVKNSDKVSFTGVKFISYDFEKKFTRTFFKKLVREQIPDAYSDIDFLIPRETLDTFKATGIFNKRAQLVIKQIEPYKGCLHDTEKKVFSILENLAKKHPNCNLQELLQLKYKSAEQILIRQQSKVMDKLNLVGRDMLSNNEFQDLRKIINQAFDKIFSQDPLPEDRFRKKEFLLMLKKMEISNESHKSKLVSIAEGLPSSEKSVNAFIVKYSQPYKLYWDKKTQSIVKIPRNSEEIGERLLKFSVNTDDHIYPQKLFRQEQEDKVQGKKISKNLSSLRVTLLCSRKMNEEKTDILVDDYIKQSSVDIPAAIQRQVDKYIKVAEKWLRQGKIEDAKLLSDYILVLQQEFALRSKIVKIDTFELDRILPKIDECYNKFIEKRQSVKTVKQRKTTSIKRTHGAANNHKDLYVGNDGKVKENRKSQIHFPKFSH
jgi:hypothetical protein